MGARRRTTVSCRYTDAAGLAAAVSGPLVSDATDKAGKLISEERDRSKAAPFATAWTFDGEIRTVRLPGNLYLKLHFDKKHEPLISEALDRQGIDARPGSYGWIWRRFGPRFRPAPIRTPPSVWPYAWCEAWPGYPVAEKIRDPHIEVSNVRHYDMVSAYGWSATSAPVPVPESAHLERGKKIPRDPESWVRVQAGEPSQLSPTCARSHQAWLRVGDLERYGVRRDRVTHSVTHLRSVDLRRYVDRLREVFPGDALAPVVKATLRASWGTWIQSEPLTVQEWANGRVRKSREMKPWTLPDLAGAIVSRANAKLHDAATKGRVYRIYTDSLITRAELPTGREPGDWKLVAKHPTLYVYPYYPGRLSTPAGPLKHSGETTAEAMRRFGLEGFSS